MDVGESQMVFRSLFFSFVHIDELRQQWEKSIAQEKAAMEEKHANEIQVKLYTKYIQVSKGYFFALRDIFDYFIFCNHYFP